ncbi:MAG: TAXI family TRAP transporter solute-binding subunit [Pseudomonadota bacterium]
MAGNLLKTFLYTGALLLGLTQTSSGVAQVDSEVKIATGGVTGIYYALGGAICRLLKLDETTSPNACEALPTRGSVANIGDLRWGYANFAIVQADIQEEAFNGTRPFARRPFADMRQVATLHPEMLTILQRPGSNTVGASESHPSRPPRVYLGIGGSGTRALARLSEKYGFETGSFELVTNINAAVSVDALCAGRLDAIFYLVGHPNDLTNQAIRQCGAELVPSHGPISDEVVAAERHFQKAAIKAGLYPRATEAILTIGVRATLITDKDTPDELVYAVVKALHDYNDELRRLHLAFNETHPNELAMACNTAPLHPAAQRFFDERGVEMGPCG